MGLTGGIETWRYTAWGENRNRHDAWKDRLFICTARLICALFVCIGTKFILGSCICDMQEGKLEKKEVFLNKQKTTIIHLKISRLCYCNNSTLLHNDIFV